MSTSFTYRGYVHEDNEVSLVNLGYQSNYSPRGKRVSVTKSLDIFGEIIESTQAEIINRARDIINAYSEDYGNARFTVDGVVAHELLNGGNDCVSGVKVVYRSFPKDDPDELATVRSFAVRLQATYDAAEEDLIAF